MLSLSRVDSIGVRQQVIDTLEAWRHWQVGPPPAFQPYALTLDMAVRQRDAAYIVECLQVLLHTHEGIAQSAILSLDDDEISDEAIDIFCGYPLRHTPCHLPVLWLWDLPYQQVHRLLTALHTNRSVKNTTIYRLQESKGALWIAELLCHKADFSMLHVLDCCFPFKKILPLLSNGQPSLKSRSFEDCRISSDILMFNDQDSSQLFVDNVLLTPSTILQKLLVANCGVSADNRPLMAGFHKNTTLVEVETDHNDDATRLFMDPILQRNVFMGFVHEVLGTTRPTTFLDGVVGEDIDIAPTNTLPPPCSLWPTVLAKVGQGTQGASPVFTILQDRLVTWIPP
jgi:hypothetical protein